jgi:hypothetical protein
MIIDLDALKVTNESLYLAVSRTLGFRHGEHSVSPHDFLPAVSRRLQDWFTAQTKIAATAKPAAPPPVVVKPAAPVVKPAAPAPVEPPKPEPQVDIAAHAREVVAREEAELKRITDESRGIARLQQYSDEQGLEETPENLAAVQTFIDASPVKGYWSREIVDAAIANLGPKGTGQLTWRKTEQPAPTPAEPTEVLGILRNGETQLPLDTSEAVLRKASLPQIRDWQSRKREADGMKYSRSVGGFSSKF